MFGMAAQLQNNNNRFVTCIQMMIIECLWWTLNNKQTLIILIVITEYKSEPVFRRFITINWNRGCEFLKQKKKLEKLVKDPIQVYMNESDSERECGVVVRVYLLTTKRDPSTSLRLYKRDDEKMRKIKEWVKCEKREGNEGRKNEPTGCFRCWSRRRRRVRQWRESRQRMDLCVGALWDSEPSCSADPDSASISYSDSETFLNP